MIAVDVKSIMDSTVKSRMMAINEMREMDSVASIGMFSGPIMDAEVQAHKDDMDDAVSKHVGLYIGGVEEIETYDLIDA